MSSRKIVSGIKDESGAFVPQPKAEPEATRSSMTLDDILSRQLLGLERLTLHLVREISAGNITRETPNQLAICIKVTMELKAKENELLDALDDQDLKKLASE